LFMLGVPEGRLLAGHRGPLLLCGVPLLRGQLVL